MAITFHVEHPTFQLGNKMLLKKWINTVIQQHSQKTGDVNFILTTDERVLEINKEYLKHDYYTDIITFDTDETGKKISGDIFISIDRIVENAEKEKVTFDTELCRVMIHGILHLIGYNDKNKKEEKEMRQAENGSLQILSILMG